MSEFFIPADIVYKIENYVKDNYNDLILYGLQHREVFNSSKYMDFYYKNFIFDLNTNVKAPKSYFNPEYTPFYKLTIKNFIQGYVFGLNMVIKLSPENSDLLISKCKSYVLAQYGFDVDTVKASFEK